MHECSCLGTLISTDKYCARLVTHIHKGGKICGLLWFYCNLFICKELLILFVSHFAKSGFHFAMRIHLKLGLCQITEFIRIFDRWFEYPVVFSGSYIQRKKCSFHKTKFSFRWICIFLLIMSHIILSSTFGRHLASLSYSQCCLCDVGQAMSGLITMNGNFGTYKVTELRPNMNPVCFVQMQMCDVLNLETETGLQIPNCCVFFYLKHFFFFTWTNVFTSDLCFSIFYISTECLIHFFSH